MVDILTDEELQETLEALNEVVAELEEERENLDFDHAETAKVYRRELSYTASVVRGILSMCPHGWISDAYLELLSRLRRIEGLEG